jgi:DNA-directed RNA polymerase subunit RPC12/RpoP
MAHPWMTFFILLAFAEAISDIGKRKNYSVKPQITELKRTKWYSCSNCGKSFKLVISDNANPLCPSCYSTRLIKVPPPKSE